jgi:serine/threonine protein kinase
MSIVAFQAADIFAIGIAFLETLSSTGHVQFEWEEYRDRKTQKASLARQKVELARASDTELWTKHLRKEGSAYGQRLTPEWTQALHLARGLICENPKQRLTAKQALKHPFFRAVQ